MELSLLWYRWCHYCGAYGPKKRCGGCKVVRYCDRTCQEKSWKDSHERDCKHIKPFLTTLDPDYDYWVEPTCVSTETPLSGNSVIKTLLSKVAPLYNAAVEEFRYAWHGQWVSVLMIPRSIEAIWPKVVCEKGLLIAHYWTCKSSRFCIKVLKSEKAYDRSLTLDGPCPCGCQTRIIIVWLLVCQRLDILPMELQYMIIEYVVADIRLCEKVRHRIFPIGGLPNTYTYKCCFFFNDL